MENRGSIS